MIVELASNVVVVELAVEPAVSVVVELALTTTIVVELESEFDVELSVVLVDVTTNRGNR